MGSNKECVHPQLECIGVHRFPMLFIVVDTGNSGSIDQTQSKASCFSHMSEIELAIPFIPNRDPPDTLNNPSSVRSCIIIHQNEVVTNSSSIWVDI
ncbi:hypothetical protein TNCV_1448041 [Trichonephila clavipes]|nr:hypothetical protein TNCV_1448041 [Trichonephila clavipes]